MKSWEKEEEEKEVTNKKRCEKTDYKNNIHSLTRKYTKWNSNQLNVPYNAINKLFNHWKFEQNVN